jgi:CHAT domain-containing protein
VDGFSALPAVQKEIAAVQAFFPGKTLLNEGFQVEKLRSELTEVPYGIVHIASHGEFGGDPTDNFLLAYDGRVSMDQLAEMVGATRFRAEQPLELLTLSACESAAGDDRAALGLAGVALGIGGATIVVTQQQLPPVITWSIVGGSVLLSVGIGLVFGLQPAWKAANIDPIEALRS